MGKNIILALLAISMLAACNQSGPAPAQSTIGIVDTARIFRESEPAKAGIKFLESVQSEMQDKLTVIQEEIQKDPTNTALQQEVQTMYAEFQQRIGAEEQNVVNLLQDALQRSVDSHRVSKKLTLVVGSEVALAYDKSVDITDDIIAEMNKQSIEFKTIVAEELTPEPMTSEDAAPATQAPATEGDAAPAKEQAPAATPESTQVPEADKSTEKQ